MKDLLIIEDDRNARRGLVRAFEKDGYAVTQAATAEEALEALKVRRFASGWIQGTSELLRA